MLKRCQPGKLGAARKLADIEKFWMKFPGAWCGSSFERLPEMRSSSSAVVGSWTRWYSCRKRVRISDVMNVDVACYVQSAQDTCLVSVWNNLCPVCGNDYFSRMRVVAHLKGGGAVACGLAWRMGAAQECDEWEVSLTDARDAAVRCATKREGRVPRAGSPMKKADAPDGAYEMQQ